MLSARIDDAAHLDDLLSAPTPVIPLRLNHAVEMRCGVLVDLASRTPRDQPIDVTMGAARRSAAAARPDCGLAGAARRDATSDTPTHLACRATGASDGAGGHEP